MDEKMEMNKRPYYHGSAAEIKEDVLLPVEQWNSVQNTRVKGAFVTSDKDYAKFFALAKCIAGRGQMHKSNNKIYMEKLAKHIKPHFYVYTVYESPEAPFIHDRGKEYYSESPIKISKREKCDTGIEIENLGYEIYVLDESISRAGNKGSDNNYAVQASMDEAIRQGKFHRVNVSELLKQQERADLKQGTNKLQNKIRQIFKKLEKTFDRD